MRALSITLAAMTALACNFDQTSEAAKPKAFPSAEGTLIVCNQQDHNVYLASLKDGRIVKKIATGTGPHEAAVSPSGKLVAVTNYGAQPPGHSLTIIELPSGAVKNTIELGQYTRPHGISWVSEDKAIVTSESTKNLVLVDVANAKVERAMPTEAQGSHMLALATDRKRVYSGNVQSNSVTAIDFATGKVLWKAAVQEGSEGIAISPDGKWIWTGNRGANSVSIVDTEKGETVKSIPTAGSPYRVQFTPDGKRVLVPCPEAGELAVFDAARMELIKRIPMNGGSEKFTRQDGFPTPGPVGVTVHPNGKYAYCAVHWSFAVAIVDLEKLEVVGKVEAGKSPDGVAVSKVGVSGS